jgi:23S rRNA pseudouridine2605 synthase
MAKIRLNKILASAGICSRRGADQLIEEGKVKLNGSICIKLGELADPLKDFITVNGKHISKNPPKKITYLLNKPEGYICSSKSYGDDKLTIDLIKDKKARLFTVGRLDKLTKGLILVTSEGDFAHKVMHPSSNIERQYTIRSKEEITPSMIEKMRKGTYIEGKKIVPVAVAKIKAKALKITVMEGKNHEVRILADRSGITISELKRVRLGNLELGYLPEGAYRILTEKEKKALFEKKAIHKRESPSTI